MCRIYDSGVEILFEDNFFVGSWIKSYDMDDINFVFTYG